MPGSELCICSNKVVFFCVKLCAIFGVKEVVLQKTTSYNVSGNHEIGQKCSRL